MHAKLRVLDVGTGASFIYPVLGAASYGWSFVGSEVNPASATSAREILAANAAADATSRACPNNGNVLVASRLEAGLASSEVSYCDT